MGRQSQPRNRLPQFVADLVRGGGKHMSMKKEAVVTKLLDQFSEDLVRITAPLRLFPKATSCTSSMLMSVSAAALVPTTALLKQSRKADSPILLSACAPDNGSAGCFYLLQTSKKRLRLLPDLLSQLCSLKNLKYTKYVCIFQALICDKISRQPLLPLFACLLFL